MKQLLWKLELPEEVRQNQSHPLTEESYEVTQKSSGQGVVGVVDYMVVVDYTGEWD